MTSGDRVEQTVETGEDWLQLEQPPRAAVVIWNPRPLSGVRRGCFFWLALACWFFRWFACIRCQPDLPDSELARA